MSWPVRLSVPLQAARNWPSCLPSDTHFLAALSLLGEEQCGLSGLVKGSLSCRALGVSVTDYTYEDCQLALAEGQLRLPADTCLLEFARLVRGLG